MIQLTRLNNQTFILNALYIEQIQALPDTTITLINGKKLVVKDDLKDVEDKVLKFYKKVGLVSATVKQMKNDGEGDDDV